MQMRDLQVELFKDQQSPLFNLLHKWYCEAQEELAAKEYAIGEAKAKHQTELNEKNTKISSLTVQVAKLNSALEDVTCKLQETTRMIERMSGVAVNEQGYVSLTTESNNAANVKASTHEIMSLLNINSSEWDKHYTDLIAYKKKFGHCNVPRTYEENKSLGNWVKYIHQQFKNGKLSYERYAVLNDIGFVWEVMDPNTTTAKWTARYNELVAYKQQYGHCHVPKSDKENKSLGKWVKYIRQQFRNGKLSDERVAVLNDIGFVWEVMDAKWTARYNELVAYKQKYGHCYVPHDYDKNIDLGRWVNNVRQQFRNGQLSDERVAMLKEIGFVLI